MKEKQRFGGKRKLRRRVLALLFSVIQKQNLQFEINNNGNIELHEDLPAVNDLSIADVLIS